MILIRAGSTLQSVDINFNPRALNEIGFRRNRQDRFEDEEFASEYERVEVRELSASADGDVHDEVEGAVLADLEEAVKALEAARSDDELLVVESEAGVDYPKTRTDETTRVVEGRNRLHFAVRIEPPLKMGIYRKRD
jgi:hypothetical protein